jgi:predicted ATPase
MIKEISIDNFKLFKEGIKIPLSSLNLFTGINGRGKSSVLQVFLLLSQSSLINRATNKIYLNGDHVRLGSLDDVKNKDVVFSEKIHFGFKFDQFSIDYYLHNANADASEVFIERIEAEYGESKIDIIRNEELYTSSISVEKDLKYPLFDLFLGDAIIQQYLKSEKILNIRAGINYTDVHYVSADRIGPKNYYENKSLNHFVSVGALGENTINILYHKGNDQVNKIVLDGYSKMFKENIEDLSLTIEENTNYWIDKIFQGAKIQVEAIKGEDLLKLRINSDGKSSYFKPTNVGYGFSYSLPIIVAGLIAKKGEILIVENPEAHLHPYAQSILAKFLSLISSSGVQVLVETHSEHILNGFRIAVKDAIVSCQELNVLYFDNKNGELFDKINIDNDGGVNTWPKDFFDQSTGDLNYLLGI